MGTAILRRYVLIGAIGQGGVSTVYSAVDARRGRKLAVKVLAPILVVGTTRDPATPYRWSRALSRQLSSARLLTYDGDGHTAYGRGSTCVDRTNTTYLVRGKAPAQDKRC
jgi:hypothetical protein